MAKIQSKERYMYSVYIKSEDDHDLIKDTVAMYDVSLGELLVLGAKTYSKQKNN